MWKKQTEAAFNGKVTKHSFRVSSEKKSFNQSHGAPVKYKLNDIDFIEKTINPPNCPGFRNVEKFRAISKRKSKKCGKTIKTLSDLKKC